MPPRSGDGIIDGYPESFIAFSRRLGRELSPQQCAAVCSIKGPVLLLAVPGSGKTTVLISRLGYMIYGLGIPPESILTMTYTVAATKDMKRRFTSFFGTEHADRVEFRTINGVCEKIIMYYARTEGRKIFDIADDGRASALVRDICREKLGAGPTDNDVVEVRTKLAYARNMMLSDAEADALECGDLPFGDIAREYRARLRAEGLMDYDDQLAYALEILRRRPAVLEHWRRTYPYVCVDEAQDTSKIQHEIIRLLAGDGGNLFMVGDEDQSIYGFRAAYPEALMTFGRDHPGARILVMDRNYRSDANIVACADRFIGSNMRRYDKKMTADRPAVAEPVRIAVRDRGEQYRMLLEAARTAKEQTAVLYRDNASAVPLVDLLDREGIPFRIRGGDYAFFSGRTVTDIRNIIRFAHDTSDARSFMKIYSRLRTGLSRAEAEAACELAGRRKCPVTDALLRVDGLDDGVRDACAVIRRQLARLTRDRAPAALVRIVRELGYGERMKRGSQSVACLQTLELIARHENSALGLARRLDELEALLKGREDGDPARRGPGVPDGAEQDGASGGSPAQTPGRGVPDSAELILTTVHSAKGLEFKNVYIADVLDGIFPSEVPSDADLEAARDEIRRLGRDAPSLPVYDRRVKLYEEERRLFYVAVTRAVDRLYVFSFKGESSVFSDGLFDEGGEENNDIINRPNTGGSPWKTKRRAF